MNFVEECFMTEQEQLKAMLEEKIQVILQDVLNDETVSQKDKVDTINDRVSKLYLEAQEKLHSKSESIEIKVPTADSPNLEIKIPSGFFGI